MEAHVAWTYSLVLCKLLLYILNPVNIFVYGVVIAAPASESVSSNFHCQSSFDCLHGICDTDTRTCKCTENWSGDMCNKEISTETVSDSIFLKTKLKESKLTDLHTDFSKHKEPETHYAKDKRFRLLNRLKHQKGDLQHDYFSNTDSQIPNDIKRTIGVEAIEAEERDICVDDSKRDLKERMCLPGLICAFGTCSQNHRDTHIVFECNCDKGAIGLFCDHKCCLDCGPHGTCSLLSNGTEYCDCGFNFHGDRCELHILDNLTGHAKDEATRPHRRMSLLIIIALSVVTVLLLLTILSLLLILRERCCLALMAIPSKCTRHHSTNGGDIIVCYHGNIDNSCTNLGIQNIQDPQPRTDILSQKPRDETAVKTETQEKHIIPEKY